MLMSSENGIQAEEASETNEKQDGNGVTQKKCRN